MSDESPSESPSESPKPQSYSGIAGIAAVQAYLPAWIVSYDALDRGWFAKSPNYRRDGVSVWGPTPEATVERAQGLMLRWTPRPVVKGATKKPEMNGATHSDMGVGTTTLPTPISARPAGDGGSSPPQPTTVETCLACGSLATVRQGPCLTCRSCGQRVGCGD